MSTKIELNYKTKITSSELDALRIEFPNGVVFFDLETTGLSPLVNKIIEIGAIKIANDSVSYFSTLINPKVKIPEATIKIHKITDDMVEDSELIEQVLPRFMSFISDHSLVAHNAKFDIGFLVVSLNNLNLPIPQSNIYCSCQYARSTFKESRNHKLSTLAKMLGLGLENHHRATDDAITCLQITAQGLIQKKKSIKKQKICVLSDYQKENMKIPDHLSLLPRLTANQELIEIIYDGGSQKGKFRKVKPTALLPMPNGNVLYALCLGSNIYKTFAISKIKEIRTTNKLT
jgi:DNA polymerase III subunit epsilon